MINNNGTTTSSYIFYVHREIIEIRKFYNYYQNHLPKYEFIQILKIFSHILYMYNLFPFFFTYFIELIKRIIIYIQY